MENILKTIIEYIKYILKLLIYFDTRVIQVGGAEPEQAGSEEGEGDGDGDVEVEKAIDDGDHKTLWFISEFKELIMSILNWFGEKAISLASTLLFASTAPILPFFFVMAGMYGGIKYFMFKIRRL